MKKLSLALCASLLLSLLASCTPAPASAAPKSAAPGSTAAPKSAAPASAYTGKGTKYSVGTSTVGGLMYVAGSGWATLMNKAFPDKYFFTPEVTGGHSANLALLESGEAEFGTVGVASAEEAYTGKGSWTGGKKLIKSRAMFPLSPMSVTAVALESKGIKTLKDLNDKIVGLGSKGAGVDAQMRTMLESMGIKVKS